VAEYRETLISLMQVCVVGHFWRKTGVAWREGS